MNFEKINNSQWDMNYASVSFVIQWINSTGHLDIVDMGGVEKSDITSFDCCDKNAVYKPDKSNI